MLRDLKGMRGAMTGKQAQTRPRFDSTAIQVKVSPVVQVKSNGSEMEPKVVTRRRIPAEEALWVGMLSPYRKGRGAGRWLTEDRQGRWQAHQTSFAN